MEYYIKNIFKFLKILSHFIFYVAYKNIEAKNSNFIERGQTMKAFAIFTAILIPVAVSLFSKIAENTVDAFFE